MDQISQVSKSSLSQSNFVQPFRIHYHQNGVQKVWDCIKAHDSVAVLIHNVTRDKFVFVKQFRPAVYNTMARKLGHIEDTIDSDKVPGSLGLTHELCAGIVDKDLPWVEIAKIEVLEECGYDAPLENFVQVTKCLSGVGTSATEQKMYYVQVTDDMKTGPGGGNPEEGEMIETVEIPVKDSLEFAMNEDIVKPLGMQYGLLWYNFNQLKEAHEKLKTEIR